MGMRNPFSAKAKVGIALGVLSAFALAAPSAGFALPSLGAADNVSGFGIFTPASVNPQLAKRVSTHIRALGMATRFTPATAEKPGERTVTVTVRVDEESARAISVRKAARIAAAKPGLGKNRLTQSQYDLGIARDYQTFAKSPVLADSVKSINMPDLSKFEPAKGHAQARPSRFQTHIALENKPARVGQPADSGMTQTVDLGGAYRITRNLNVTAGVRLSQETDRLAPLVDDVQDSQAVYVGTQFRF